MQSKISKISHGEGKFRIIPNWWQLSFNSHVQIQGKVSFSHIFSILGGFFLLHGFTTYYQLISTQCQQYFDTWRNAINFLILHTRLFNKLKIQIIFHVGVVISWSKSSKIFPNFFEDLAKWMEIFQKIASQKALRK